MQGGKAEMSGLTTGDSSNPTTTTGFGSDDSGKSSPRQMAAAAGETVKQEVATFASAAQEKAKGQVETTAESATRTLGEFASAIKTAGDELSQHDQSLAGKMVKQAGDGLENLARSLSDKRPEELMDAVRDFGRRNPVAFIAGGVLLGLAAGRFMRSSAPHAGASAGSGIGEPRTFGSTAADQSQSQFEDAPGSDYVSEASGFMEGPADLQYDPDGAAARSRPPYSPGV
jgi:hypothetical protein